MKHFNRFHFGLVPLLSILSISPSEMVTNHNVQRGIASLPGRIRFEESLSVKEEHLRYDSIAQKIDRIALMKGQNQSPELLKSKELDLTQKIKKVREEFQKEQADKIIVKDQRVLIETLISDTLRLELGIKDAREDAPEKTSQLDLKVERLEDSKLAIESLLKDLEANELLVAQASEVKPEEPKVEEKPIVVEAPESKEPKSEVKPTTTEAEKPKVEEKKEEEKKEIAVCEHDEKNQALTKQVEQLMADQNKIMQTMLGMAQMMVGMYQNQQQIPMPNPYYANGFQIQNPYMYNQPFTAGNWVYQPNGQQPSQQGPVSNVYNIFNQSRAPGSMYPDQMNQPNNWNLKPQMSFPSAPNSEQMPIPGTFGFNLSNEPVLTAHF